MDKSLFERAGGQEFVLKLEQNIMHIAISEYALALRPDRVKFAEFLNDALERVVRALFSYITWEEPIRDIPANWWEAWKERWFPGWLKKRVPVKYLTIMAVHKFPEADVPENIPLLGQEFVHLKIIPKETAEEYLRALANVQQEPGPLR